MRSIILCLILILGASSAHAATIRELYEQAGEAYNHQDYDRAISLYQEIIKMAPHFAPAYAGIGLALKDKGGDNDEVMYYYKTATIMDPTNAAAFEQLGRLYYSLDKFDKAEKNFQKALSIDPGMLSAKLSLAWIYLLNKSKPEVAIQYFKTILKKTPSPNVYFGLGMAYFADNDRPQAMEIITQLHKMGQEDFAARLEKMMRENRKVALVPTEDTDHPSAADADSTGEDFKPAPAAAVQLPKTASPQAVVPQAPAIAVTGIKVRLRGKLSETD